jgi:hypothetical protein
MAMSTDLPPVQQFSDFTAAAAEVMVNAQQEAERARHPYVGGEHILLGLLSTRGAAAAALDQMAVSAPEVRHALSRALARPEAMALQHVRAARRVKRVVELSRQEALQAGRTQIGTGHLLLGLAADTAGIATGILAALGVTGERLRTTLGQFGAEMAAEEDSAGTPDPAADAALFDSLFWAAPPADYLGTPVGVELVLARSPKALVTLGGVSAYPVGFEFRLAIRLRPGLELPHPLLPPDGRPSDDHLRLTLELGDGRELELQDSEALLASGARAGELGLAPDQAGMVAVSGMGRRMLRATGQRYAELNCWAWPLPPRAVVTFQCRLPRFGIDHAHPLEGSIITDTARGAVTLWRPRT